MAKTVVSIATLGPVGYLPAPGTAATCVILPFMYLFSYLSFPSQLLLIGMVHLVGFFVIHKALPYFSQPDPKQIVLDEFVGTLVTFAGIAYDPLIFLIGFCLFRLFDIFKPCGIGYVEKLPGAFGVVLDDSVAGLFANLVLRSFFV
ncbi:phosphatidylglycerophosphatase A [Candidatus Babeliales bacterium]|nr:phosphatidylglycerophosphatase A [Candidatus Babeliales bacterium]MBP9843326.1 phosphatidylglycerophosphatase A [Candidatus Babeliales bacterium]